MDTDTSSFLGGLPLDAVGLVFMHLEQVSRTDAVALALTSSAHLSLYRALQKRLVLPDARGSAVEAVTNVVPKVAASTREVVLSNAALDRELEIPWTTIQPLIHVDTLHIPTRKSSFLSSSLRMESWSSCLGAVLACFPRLRRLSVSMASPGPHPAIAQLVDILSCEPLEQSVASWTLQELVVSATGRSLHPDAQRAIPALLQCLSKDLIIFSLVMPPSIVPTSFITQVCNILGDCKQLRECHLTVPHYDFLSSNDGYSRLPHLTSLTLGTLPECTLVDKTLFTHHQRQQSQAPWSYEVTPGSPTIRDGTEDLGQTLSFPALLSHLHAWNDLQTITIHSAPRSGINGVFAVLEPRVRSVAVHERPGRSEQMPDWFFTPSSHAMVGIDVDDVVHLFTARFCRPDIVSMGVVPPDLFIHTASRRKERNILRIHLVVSCGA